MKNLFIYIFGLILIIVSYNNAFAQRGNDWSGPWGIGVGLGPTAYIGDLNEHNDNRFLIIPQSLSFAGSGWFSKGFGPLTFVLQMNLGRLQSRDYTKDQQFRNNFYDYGGRLRINMNQVLQGRRYQVDKWHFYLQGGMGLMRYSAYLTDLSEDELIGETGYVAIGKATSIIGGAGLQYYMTDEASLHIGVDYHFLNMDDIDAKIIGTANDAYLYMSIGFSYAFGNAGFGGGKRRSVLWGRF